MITRILAGAALVVACVSCSTAQPPRRCPALPEPLGNTIAAQRAFTLLVIQMYGACASGKY